MNYCRYKRKVMEALFQDKQNPTIMSIIIDGMDQSKVCCPNCGSQDSFDKPLKQYVVGVKEHGHKVSIFATNGTVQKGADLTIHCILLKIEEWKQRNEGRYPEKIYLQLDGGSENANQYVIGMLELLVTKMVAREIVFSRLPTGHTHEDIDACFGVIRQHLFDNEYETLTKFKTLIESAFVSKNLKAEVNFINVIPDYKRFLSGIL